MDIVSGTVHATPSFETFVLVIALATYRVFATSAPGWVQPAAGRPVPAGAVPVTAVPRLDGHASVLELLLLSTTTARAAAGDQARRDHQRRACHRGPAAADRTGFVTHGSPFPVFRP